MKIILTVALSVLLISCTALPPKQGIPTNSVDHTLPSAMAMGSAWMTERVGVQQVQYRVFQSTAAGATVSYHVYVPVAYDRQPNARFPVLYWLHGTGGGVRGIAPISRYFDDAIRTGKIAPMLVVFANGLPEGMWCDSADGKTPVETVFERCSPLGCWIPTSWGHVRRLTPPSDRVFFVTCTLAARLAISVTSAHKALG